MVPIRFSFIKRTNAFLFFVFFGGGGGGCTCGSPCYDGVVDCSYDPKNHFVGDEKQEFNKG